MSSVLAVADFIIKILDEALMFREKPIGACTGSFAVADIHGKLLTLYSGKRTWTASMNYGKAFREHESASKVEHPAHADIDHQKYLKGIDKYKTTRGEIFGSTDAKNNDGNSLNIYALLIEIIPIDHSRAKGPDFIAAKKKRSMVFDCKNCGIL